MAQTNGTNGVQAANGDGAPAAKKDWILNAFVMMCMLSHLL
jgi:hypothetical protein